MGHVLCRALCALAIAVVTCQLTYDPCAASKLAVMNADGSAMTTLMTGRIRHGALEGAHAPLVVTAYFGSIACQF